MAFRAIPGETPQKTGAAVYHQQIELSDHTDNAWASYPTGRVNGAFTTTGPALFPTRPVPPTPADGWNRAEIEFRGQVVTVRVNDEELHAADLVKLIKAGSPCPALHRKQGRLGFQQHAKTASFRNVGVLELK